MQRNGRTSACEIASREAKYGQVWDACPVAIRSSISFGDAFDKHETTEAEAGNYELVSDHGTRVDGCPQRHPALGDRDIAYFPQLCSEIRHRLERR
jgi:hypothetical protein